MDNFNIIFDNIVEGMILYDNCINNKIEDCDRKYVDTKMGFALRMEDIPAHASRLLLKKLIII